MVKGVQFDESNLVEYIPVIDYGDTSVMEGSLEDDPWGQLDDDGDDDFLEADEFGDDFDGNEAFNGEEGPVDFSEEAGAEDFFDSVREME